MPWPIAVPLARFCVPEVSESASPESAHRLYWQRTVKLTVRLLFVWFVLTFGLIFFARDLQFQFFGWPFGFWAAAQGVLLVYLGLIAFYAHAMNRLDAAHGVAEGISDD
jgi:putative solute:sodium symporter small subunit